MILVYLIVILIAGGVVSMAVQRWSTVLCRIIALATVLLDLFLLINIFYLQPLTAGGPWIMEYSSVWITHFGISLHLAIDGLSLLLLALTFFLGFIAILISWNEIQEKVGFFHFNVLWTLAGVTGVFISLDLFLFYFFWELMLIPMYLLISVWGHENKIYASYKFFLYTQASGLIMFIAILILYLIHGRNTGIYSFDYEQLLGTDMPLITSMLLMLGFLAAFLVKLPVVPLHNWLPDAHSEAPTAGSLILAGLLLKTGAYGVIRFAVPFFPSAAEIFAPVGMILGVIGILYGAKLAFAQTDLKRLIAYTSVSHMGFVILGIYAFNEMAYQGVVMQMLTHGISTGALFVIAGQLIERLHHRDIEQMGGFWTPMPVMGGFAMVFVMASLGLPGLGNFIAEFLVLSGTFKADVLMTCLASIGLVLATVYSLRIMQKIYFGQQNSQKFLPDLGMREKFIAAALIIAIVFLGLFPQPVIETARPVFNKTLNKRVWGTGYGVNSDPTPQILNHEIKRVWGTGYGADFYPEPQTLNPKIKTNQYDRF